MKLKDKDQLKVQPNVKTLEQREDQYHLVSGDVVYQTPPAKTQRAPQDAIPERDIKCYEIIGQLSSVDSYGYSYLASEVNPESTEESDLVFIRTPRISRNLPILEVHRKLSEIEASFRAEFQNNARIKLLNDPKSGVKVAAEVLARGSFLAADNKKGSDEVEIPFIVKEFINEFNMTQFFHQYNGGKYIDRKSDPHRFAGITEPDLWFDLAEKIIDIVRRIHNKQVIHGEIVPKNILLQERNGSIYPILVDFGKSFLLDATSLTGSRDRNSPYIAPESREQDLGWYMPADIYSLGGVLYYLSTGFAPPDIEQHSDIFTKPNSWAFPIPEQTDEWKKLIHRGFEKNAGLMEKNEGIVKIIDKCLRTAPSDRYSSAERLIQGLNAVNYQKTKERDIGEELKKLNETWERINSQDKHGRAWDDVFASIVSTKLRNIGHELENMDNGHYEIYGEREDLIDTLVKYIGVLQPGDVYVTVTVPEYWTEANLGINGRFLTVNKDLARNGVLVNRLFLLSPEDLMADSPSRTILAAHLQAWRRLDDPLRATSPNFEDSKTGMLYVGYMMFSDKESAKNLQRQTEHVAIWSRAQTHSSTEKKMSIIFVIRPDYKAEQGRLEETGGQIVKIRFRELERPYEYNQLKAIFQPKEIRPLSDLAEQLGLAPESPPTSRS